MYLFIISAIKLLFQHYKIIKILNIYITIFIYFSVKDILTWQNI